VWQEGAGSLLLLAAAHETGLLETLEAALPLASPTCPPRLAHSTRASRERLLLTLLFLNAVGLRRTWDLHAYTGTALALLSRRQRAYGYWHTERFLAQVAHAGGDEALTDALAAWTATLWPREAPKPDQLSPAFYLDGHKKPVVRRVTRHESPVQPGWVGKEAHGLTGLPGDESQRGQEHAGNARNDQKTLMTWPRAPAS
jgi:hypothetical protein